MRLEFLAILLLIFSMVACGARGCSWNGATSTRGLNRHRASCHFYKTSSILARQKRTERARDAALANLVPKISGNAPQVSSPSLR